jgi:DEAD/DEAH box helicase domain-containing protein
MGRAGRAARRKMFVFVNPPVVNHQLGIRRSYHRDAAHRVKLERNLQLIAFAQSRLSTEILTTIEGRLQCARAPDVSAAIEAGICRTAGARSKRACASSVRAVKKSPRAGSASAGGALDVAVMAGYPGTSWRCGSVPAVPRRAGKSAGVMVASSAPLD